MSSSQDPSDEECAVDFSSMNGIDLSRLPPKVYLRNDAALKATRREIYGLLTGSSSSIAPMIIISLTDPLFLHVPRYPTTLVVRVKQTGLVKARMCLRGDRMSTTHHSFLSSSTIGRSIVKVMVSLAATFQYTIAACDITQAFLQSTTMDVADQYVALPPPCVILSDLKWSGLVASEPDVSRRRGFAFLRRKPLYGSKCAPLRWYLTVSGILRRAGYRCHRSDLCIFIRRQAGILVSIVILHVDAFLICATSDEHEYFQKSISLKSGPIIHLTVHDSFVFCGLTFLCTKNGSFGISQDEYRSRLIPIDRGFAVDVPVAPLKLSSLSRICRAFVGGSLWMLQTRYGISFLTIKLATLVSLVESDVDSRREFIQISQIIAQTLFQTDVAIWFHPIPSNCDISRLQLIAFADAGFHSLPLSSSIESFCIGWDCPYFAMGLFIVISIWFIGIRANSAVLLVPRCRAK